jgi:transposase-like protein
MAKRGPKGYNETKIVEVLRAVEAARAQGVTIKEAVLQHSISEQTYYKWKRTYGAMQVDEVKRLRELEKENARLKKLVADLSLDKDILKEALEGKY